MPADRPHQRSNRRLIAVRAAAGVVLLAAIARGGETSPPRTPEPERDIAGEIAGNLKRYLTHVTTDKPIYRAGETIRIRGVMLEVNSHRPRPQTDKLAHIEIRGPKGEVAHAGDTLIVDSVVGYDWSIPWGLAGGVYTVRISHPATGDPPGERAFDIRSYRAVRLKSQIVFLRDGYGPGDTVRAHLKVERAEGGFPVGAQVSVAARLDGNDVWKGETIVDSGGNAQVAFSLPAAIGQGDGTIAMTIQDGGTVETATRTIPILLDTIDVRIYPEGGDLIAGLANRVYFESRTRSRKPADIAGVLVSSAGREVAAFRSEHEGRGRFTFTPVRGESYFLRVTEPGGIRTPFPLPAARESGVVITATSDASARGKSVELRLAASAAGTYRVALSQRGRELASKSLALKPGQPADIAFDRRASVDGVVTATVYDSRRTPVGERLLFLQPERRLKVLVRTDRSRYEPGGVVKLAVMTADESGKPVSAVVGLTVTDSSVLEMIDKREQAPRLPAMALLENDVQELSDAHVYLDETNPKAPLAIDLLLGTQGWRRFATADPARFVAVHGAAARRALGVRTTSGATPAGTDPDRPGRERPDLSPEMTQQPAPASDGDPLVVLVTTLPGYRAHPLVREKVPLWNALPNIGTDPLTAMANFIGYRERVLDEPPPPFQARPFVVREYAHTNYGQVARSDFTETVYWHAGVKTDPSTGTATLAFNLSDSVTSFRVLADAYASDGALGATVRDIEAIKPFSIEPKMPMQVTSGDVVQLPVTVINGSNRDMRRGEISPGADAGLTFTLPEDDRMVLPAGERARRLLQVDVARGWSGIANVKLRAWSGTWTDSVIRPLDVQPWGFPFEHFSGGVLEAKTQSSFTFTIPSEITPGSVSTSVILYPTPLAHMSEALRALVREPNGCFEQTSSVSYPMVMAQQYFLTHAGDPDVIEKAKTFLDTAYRRLIGFEAPGGGFEWFGEDPGHEALTAYGLLQFTDMSQVRSVDKIMLKRVREWLLSRRDGKGGYLRGDEGHSFGASRETATAYITWALVEAGESGLEKEVAAARALANSTSDSYIVALAANILHLTGDRAGARLLMDKLAAAQDKTGMVKGAVTSITQSGGASLQVETTALGVLAWTRAGEAAHVQNVENGVRWIAESNKDGRFGSTQATILALRAVIAHDAADRRVRAPGRAILIVDGKPVGAPLSFSADAGNAIVLPAFGAELGPGKHTVTLQMEDGFSMPFSMSVRYHGALAVSDEQAQVGIQVALRDSVIQEGGVTEAVISIANRSDKAAPTPLAIVGIPGGLEVRHDHLKDLVKSGRIDAWEIRGREVVLYWRSLAANAKFDLPLSLVAAVPGAYTGPASRAYLYYTDEFKTWVPGVQVRITPR